jgi:hypothetical protein
MTKSTTKRRRRTYEQRTKATTEAARILARAVTQQIEYMTTPEGDRVRVWRPEELQRFTNADIAKGLSYRRAVEHIELLDFIPPTGIKYALTKGWISKDRRAEFYWVTQKGADELNLPRKVGGITIRFLKPAKVA